MNPPMSAPSLSDAEIDAITMEHSGTMPQDLTAQQKHFERMRTFARAIEAKVHTLRAGQSEPVAIDVEKCAAEASGSPLFDALNHARAWIDSADHGDNCFLHNDGGEYDACFCGRDSVLQALDLALVASDSVPLASTGSTDSTLETS